MRTVVVRYKVRPEAAAENERLIREVFAQLEREKPAGLRYQNFKLDDGVSFVHIATIDDTLPEHPLTSLTAFREFTAGIKGRCEELPVTVTAHVIGGYDAGAIDRRDANLE